MKPISIRTLTLTICLLLAVTISSTAQTTAVLDTSGEPLLRGREYHIKPAITDNGGRFTIVARTPPPSCPLYVGQEGSSAAEGTRATFAPFAEGIDTVNLSTDLQITFSAATTCLQGTTWVLSGGFIVVGSGNGDLRSDYFKIVEGKVEGTYGFEWCPWESCASIGCSPPFRCQPVGSVVENGVRLLALDAPNSPIPVVFERVN